MGRISELDDVERDLFYSKLHKIAPFGGILPDLSPIVDEAKKEAAALRTEKNHDFRPLNYNEYNIIRRTINHGTELHDYCLCCDLSIDIRNLVVSYERFNRTIVCVILSLDGRMWRGFSHCALDDRYNATRGEVIAFKRAICESRQCR